MYYKQNFDTHNTTPYAARPIKYIVVHYTAGVTDKAGTAINCANWFANEKCLCSADFIVDSGGAVQYNPDIKNRYTWHCGGAKYPDTVAGAEYYRVCTNKNSIGIEICSCNKSGKMTAANDGNYSFTAQTIANAAELVRKLMNEYNIPVDNVIRHYDVTGKPCPGVWGYNEDSGNADKWAEFKRALAATNTIYRVQVGAYKNREYAEAEMERLKKFGFNAYITT